MTSIELASALVQQTRNLIALAGQDDWSAFEALQKERDALMDAIARLEVAADEVEPVRALLIEVRELNQQLTELADDKAADLLKQKRTLDKGRQMQRAYGDG